MADDLSSRSLFLTVLETVLIIVFNVLSLTGNTLVCLSVYRNTRLRTTTNLYIVALAVSDLLSAVFVMPLATGVLISGRWPFGETVCQMQAFFTAFVVYVTPVTMGLTALNRYVRICKTDRQFKRVFSQRNSCIFLMSAWAIVALHILIPRLAGLQESRFVPGYATCLNETISKPGRIASYFVAIGLFVILPLSVTIFGYRKVFKKIREHNMGTAQAFQSQPGHTAVSSHEIRISRSLLIIVFAFMLCWTPAWIITILTRLRVVENMPRNVELLCAFCLNLSNAINPFIYAGMNPMFRNEFRSILRCESGSVSPAHSPIRQMSNKRPNTFFSRANSADAENNNNQAAPAHENRAHRDDGSQINVGIELK